MFRPIADHDERALADQLRREARESRPAFSETLHGRILRAVEDCRARDALTSRRGRLGHALARSASEGWWSAHGVHAAAAAVCLLAVVALGWQLLERVRQSDQGAGQRHVAANADPPAGTPADRAADPEALSDLADQAAETLDGLLESAVAVQQTAYLEHDARLAAEALLDRLPLDLVSLDLPPVEEW